MFASELCLVARWEPGEWALTAPLIWQEPKLRIEVPTGFITDLASIPSGLRGSLNVTGLSRRPAVVHDYLYCVQTIQRPQADDFLRRALIAEGETFAVAQAFWLGVRLGGASHWYSRKPGLQPEDFVQQ